MNDSVLYGIAIAAIIVVIPSAYAALPETVHIGALVPITGDGSGHGDDIRVTIDLAEEDFNQYLEEAGADWRLDVLLEDSATNPVVALEKLTALNSKGITAVAGTYSSAELRNIRGYATANDILLVSYGSTAPELSIPDDNIYRFVPNEATQAPAIAKSLDELGITNIVPVWRGDAWGDGLQRETSAAFTAIGGAIDDGVRYNPEAIEFSAEMSVLADRVQGHIDEVGNDRVAVVLFTFSEATSIIQAADQYGPLSEVLWFSTNTLQNYAEFEQDPLVHDFVNKAGLIISSWSMASNPELDMINEKAVKVTGRTPNIYAVSAYDVIWALGLSIQEAESTASNDIIDAMPIVLESYRGGLGEIVLNEAGDIGGGLYEIYKRDGSEWVLIATYQSITDVFTVVRADAMTDDAMTESGGCLIATAAYGSELAPQVQMLREIRDSTLYSTGAGTSFMTGFNQVYYTFSPAVADLEIQYPVFREGVQAVITPGIYALSIVSLADQNSDLSVIVFGILSIAAVAGIYVIGPVMGTQAIRRVIASRTKR